MVNPWTRLNPAKMRLDVLYDSLVEIYDQVDFFAEVSDFPGCWFGEEVCFENSRARR